MTKHRKALLTAAAIAAFLIKVLLAFFTIGTNDMVTFERMLEKLQTRGTVALYAEGTDVTINGAKVGMIQMNHPPFSLNLLTAWGALEKFTKWPLRFWMRSTCALADLLTVWLLWRLGLDFWAVFALAISPGTIMVSGFHGNTDPIMISMVVLAVYFADSSKSAWLAGAAYGLGCSVKAWPLLLGPILFIGMRTWTRRAQFCGAAAVVVAIAGLPWLLKAPALILRNVLDYTPFSGWWGIAYLLPDIELNLKVILFAATLLSMLLMQGHVRTVFAQCSVVTCVFFLLAPGFGPQYMAWLLPWTVAAGWEMAVLYQAAAGVFLFGMYNSWCRGMPWGFADANQFVPDPWVLPWGVVPWVLLVPLIYQVCRKNWASAATRPEQMVSSQAR